MTQLAPDDLPLQVKIEGEQIVMRIGLNVLKVVAEHCPLLSEDGEATAPPYAKVVDNRQLAKDVIHELDRGDETGMNPLMEVIDQAIASAHEEGSLAFEGDDDE